MISRQGVHARPTGQPGVPGWAASLVCLAAALLAAVWPFGALDAAGREGPDAGSSAEPPPPTAPGSASAAQPPAAPHHPSTLVRGLAPLPGNAPVPLHDRPPGAFEDDGGPSPVIFPAQKLTIRFNHKKHMQELGLTCLTCHDAARTSRKSSDSLLPTPERCDGCHGTDHRDLARVTTDPGELIGQCGFCHIGYREGDGNRVERMVIPTPHLRFDHRRHLDRNIGCQQCHGEVQNLELATRDQLPRMRGCFRCHQAPAPDRGDAKGACTTCHLTQKNGVLRTELPTGRLLPPTWLHDAGHGPDWVERHKLVAGTDSSLCGSCHTERYCTDCHDGRVRPRRVHPNDFLSSHPAAARMGDPRCGSCHREQSFCLGCHQRSGVTMSGPWANFSGRGRFHPAPSTWTDAPRGPGHHSWEAQRNLDACVSCHVEKDCATCHATQARGGRGPGLTGAGQSTNPHPVGFRSRCGAALRQNARPCLVCHDPRDSKLPECR